MNSTNVIKQINEGGLDARLISLYGEEKLPLQKQRYIKAVNEFCSLYGNDHDISLFSVSGRSELSGNHTDHNYGKVIATSVDLDIIAVAAKTADNSVKLKSEGHRADEISFDKYKTPENNLFGTSASLIAGMGAGFVKRGFSIGGFVQRH